MNTHRWVGLTAAIFLILLTITGILLQHPSVFGFNQRFIQSEMVLGWYGIELGKVDTTFQLDDGYLTLVDGEVYWQYPHSDGDLELSNPLVQVESLTGAAIKSDSLVFTDAFYYYLFSAITAEPIEQIKAPAVINQSGAINGHLVFRSEDTWFQLVETTAQFTEIPAQDSQQLSQPTQLPEALAHQLHRARTSRIISWQQLLTDLHTGRLFGSVGIVLIDLAALAILILAITGLWNWSARRRV